MNTKTMVTALGLIGTVLGIAVVANYSLGKEASVPKAKEPNPLIPKGISNSMPPQSEYIPSPTPKSAEPLNEELASSKNENVSDLMINENALNNKEVEVIISPPITIEQIEVQKELVTAPKGDEFPLRLGSTGPRVERLQVFLLRNYGLNAKVTGVFDESTEAELKRRLHRSTLDEGCYQRYRMGKHVNEQVIIR